MSAWRWRLIYRAAKAQFQTISFPSDYVRGERKPIYPPIRSIGVTIRNPLATSASSCIPFFERRSVRGLGYREMLRSLATRAG